MVVTISIESIRRFNVILLFLCDEPTCTQSYTYFCRHCSYRIGLKHICTVHSYSIHAGTYCTYSTVYRHILYIYVQYTGTYCTYSTVYRHILYIYVQYTGTYCTYMYSTQVHTVHIFTVHWYILYIYVQYTGTYYGNSTCEGSSPFVHSTCTSYVLCTYLYCVYALVGWEISIHDPYICAVSRVCAKESHAVFHRPVVCAVKT